MSNHNNLEEYRDPDLYDLENDSFLDDLPLIEKFAKQVEGPVVELACGTGRATLRLAEKGIKIVGVDLHEKMLRKAREKANLKNVNIRFLLQDCTSLNLGIKSSFIFMVGNSFQHFLTNQSQDELFASVYRHLNKGGIFLFGTRFPSRDELMQPDQEEYWRSYVDFAGQKVDVYTVSQYDDVTQIQTYRTIRRRAEKEDITQIQLRYVYPKEMERLLKDHGFTIIHQYGSWDQAPLTNKSSSMIYICKK
ncbi:class I SAM-dependent methyltransferase [Alkalihalobacterium elongatum]|uniref:class I SAM-dependent methyltransferase n=1 Tax=Alkalihalobacterium elongatum TaxID=2675466 RepID=UPI001C1FC79F|nr:class I SAM-dependent methyltransferase [Alkalihalobacterium elongatum]